MIRSRRKNQKLSPNRRQSRDCKPTSPPRLPGPMPQSRCLSARFRTSKGYSLHSMEPPPPDKNPSNAVPSELADASLLAAALRDALTRADWDAITVVVASLVSARIPENRGEVAVLLDLLEGALASIKGSRARDSALRCRVRAACSFSGSGSGMVHERQVSANLAGFCRSEENNFQ